MQFASDTALADLEEAYRALLEAWGTWMVGHHRGTSPVAEARHADALVASRTAVAERLSMVPLDGLTAEDAAAVRTMRACLPELDALAEPLDGRAFSGANSGAADDGNAMAESPETVGLRRSTSTAWGAAMANLTIGDERLDRLTVTARLARDDDEARRREMFLSMEPAWRVVNDEDEPSSPYRRLLADSAVRWARDGSPIDANAAALGMDPASVEPTMRRILGAFRQVATATDLVEPWNYRYVLGGLARRIDPLVPLERLRQINDEHLRTIGADPVTLRIQYDIEPRPDRPVIGTAFTVSEDIATRGADGTWVGSTPWVFATYLEGGFGNLEELLHESGHALHYAAIRTRPAHFAWPPEQTAFVEAIADVVAWTVHEPAFLRQHLGVEVTTRESVIARFGGVILDAAWTLFEIELHRNPDRSPNEAWSEIAERDLGIRGRPEWSWWASRGQLIDSPGYLANYALGAVMVAAVRDRIRSLRGDWATGDPGWYAYVSEALLQYGGARAPVDLLKSVLGGPLTADALIANIEAGG